MLTSALVVMTLLPFQISPRGGPATFLDHPISVAVFIDTAKILGLPKFRIRDGNGNPYLPGKEAMRESLALGTELKSEISQRKAYILSYVRR